MLLIISTIHILASLFLICLVLLQQGKGADMGASFGGDSSSLFGPMVENPLKNLTTIVAIVFMTTSVSLAYQAKFGISTEGRLFTREAATAPSATESVTNTEVPKNESANSTTDNTPAVP